MAYLLGIDGHWATVKDGDPRLVSLYSRHYSANPNTSMRARIRYGVSGQGESMVLLTADAMAAFIWIYNTVARMDGQTGVQCSFFRNESPVLSSTLIREACELAWQRWPNQRLYTYVNDSKITSVNPGYCYKMANWRYCGRNKSGKLSILEILPEAGQP